MKIDEYIYQLHDAVCDRWTKTDSIRIHLTDGKAEGRCVHKGEEAGVVVHACTPAFGGLKRGCCEFKASLGA